ncbi:hypothetical protein M0R45_005020 [Rubus argutus]|uniref:Uncharacterized protein n=1 Tax=Rubus argutus TaxID=59490 RepID=A0AAW1YLI9_RUBAR
MAVKRKLTEWLGSDDAVWAVGDRVRGSKRGRRLHRLGVVVGDRDHGSGRNNKDGDISFSAARWLVGVGSLGAAAWKTGDGLGTGLALVQGQRLGGVLRRGTGRGWGFRLGFWDFAGMKW